MENRRFDPEGEDDSTPEASSNKKKRGGSAVSRILAGLKRKEQENNAENDTTDERPKRFRSIFSKLFPRVVEKPDTTATETPEREYDPETWFSWTQFANRTEATGNQSAEQEQLTTEQPLVGVTETSTEPQQEAVHSEAVEPQSVFAPEASTPEPNPAEVKPRIEPVSSELPLQQHTPITQGELFVREQPHVETLQTPNIPEKEVVIERGPGMVLPVALVGLEHLGRKKADKKLEKRVNEKIAATTKEVESSVALQQELETLRRQNNEQLEALKHAREERPIDVARRSEKPVERLPEARPEHLNIPEKPTPVPEVKEHTRTGLEQRTAEDIKPEKIFEQVADAAEQGMPVERIFERSHEIKDDNTIPGAAASVGAVVSTHAVATQYQAQQQLQQNHLPANSSTNLLPLVADPAARAVYQQAIKLGFWAAIMIIILGSIAYLMVK